MAKTLRKCNFRELTYAFYDLEGNLQNADANDPTLRDWNAPKETRGRGARCYAAPTLSAVQEDGLSRDTKLRNDYDKALLDGITLAVRLLSY